MYSVLLINARSYETRVTLIENGQCVELYVERHKQSSVAGNIYLGRVVRVLPGMQAAFVNIGLSKSAFLYVNDVQEIAKLCGDQPAFSKKKSLDHNYQQTSPIRIENILHEGQDIMVQVIKEPLGNKGARISSYIALTGRNLVFMPTINRIGISRRIEDEKERARLRSILEEIRPVRGGFIARTVSEGQDKNKLQAEMNFLCSLWESINNHKKEVIIPSLLYQDLSVSLRAARDLFTYEIDYLIIDCKAEYDQLIEFVSTFMPSLLSSVELYHGNEPLFDAYGVEPELSRAFGKKVWLKSGGYIIIEKTEALTAIDINTGRYTGKHNPEETILKTNLEAVKEIAYQLRLRDIGGLIVIDFIDMEYEVNRARVVSTLKEVLLRDRSKTKILGMSALGLVEMTRKRVRESLDESLNETCFYCDGSGMINDPSTICYDVLRNLERNFRKTHTTYKIKLRVNPRVADVLLMEERYALEELEQLFGVTIHIYPDSTLHQEHFEISSLL